MVFFHSQPVSAPESVFNKVKMKLSLGIVAAAAVCSAQTQPTVTTLSGGHIWLENLGFSSARGGLFFSDAFTGEIFKVCEPCCFFIEIQVHRI